MDLKDLSQIVWKQSWGSVGRELAEEESAFQAWEDRDQVEKSAQRR